MNSIKKQPSTKKKRQALERVELIFIEKNKVSDLNIDFKNGNIGTVYIRVDVDTISFTRQFLIEQGYSTRLMVIPDVDNIFYIYGRKKASNAVFNEHCKNTVIRSDDYIEYLIRVSSNNHDTVLTDSNEIIEKNIDREWVKYA